jgi:hypothetical protein
LLLFRYYVYRAWGRIGTSQGGTKLDDCGDDVDDAKQIFETLVYI